MRSDACIYIWHTENDFVIIVVWVDEALIFATMTKLRDRAQTDIKEEWEVTDLSELTKIVGIKIMKKPNQITNLSSRYIDAILLKEELSWIDKVSTPLDLNLEIVANPEGNVGSHSNFFARLLRELQYIANAM